MMRIFAYFINIILIAVVGCATLKAQDTVYVPLKIRTGIEVSGPAMYFFDKNILSTEANFSYDISEKRALMIGGGYVNYNYSQHNYDYKANGIFFKAGVDFNLMGPKKAQGKYFTGIGLHYGISRFSSEVPLLKTENYWGPVQTSVPSISGIAHFVEATPSVRAEIFRNVSIGWNINIRVLLSSGTGSDLRMLYLPGFGDAGKKVSTGLSYFITWNIPYRTKRVIILPPAPEDDEDVAPGVTP
ncbi:MAG: DUF6048 family protein [Chloroflexota bacterium]